MIDLNSLKSISVIGKKRLGQGHGSGKGKTAGRGTKGQNARGAVRQTTGGGVLAWVRRMPLYRGKYRNKPVSGLLLPINLKYLSNLPAGTVVDFDTLVKNNVIVSNIGNYAGVKILGDGEITVALTVKLPTSKSAKAKIEKAGGKVE